MKQLITFSDDYELHGRYVKHVVIDNPQLIHPNDLEGLVGFGYGDGVGFLDGDAVESVEKLARGDTPTGVVTDLNKLREFQEIHGG